MKPTTLVTLLGVILLVVVVVILWQLDVFKQAEPPPPLPPIVAEPITTTLVAGELITSPILAGQSFTPTVMTEPAVSHYITQPGDTLWSISKKFYNNDGTKHKLIAKANKAKIPDPNRIKPGMEIVIPQAESTGSPISGMGEVKHEIERTEGGQYHTVRKGDSLSTIAKKFYGSGSKKNTDAIWEANRDKMATPETTLKVGWKLLVPKSAPAGSGIRKETPPKTTPPPVGDKTKVTDNVPVGSGD